MALLAMGCLDVALGSYLISDYDNQLDGFQEECCTYDSYSTDPTPLEGYKCRPKCVDAWKHKTLRSAGLITAGSSLTIVLGYVKSYFAF